MGRVAKPGGFMTVFGAVTTDFKRNRKKSCAARRCNRGFYGYLWHGSPLKRCLTKAWLSLRRRH